MPTSSRLQGVVAPVTGAARMRGIGRAIALELAADGADVVVAAIARRPEEYPEHERASGWREVQSVADPSDASQGDRMDCDVTQREQVAAMFDRTSAN
jgi:NAD(P)-dependent dehydrogenase (short-subunit alcohol dehydrogenase family)